MGCHLRVISVREFFSVQEFGVSELEHLEHQGSAVSPTDKARASIMSTGFASRPIEGDRHEH